MPLGDQQGSLKRDQLVNDPSETKRHAPVRRGEDIVLSKTGN